MGEFSYLLMRSNLSMPYLKCSGTSKAADFLPILLKPFTDSLSYSEVFFLKKENIKPGDWYSMGHLTI